MRSAAITTFAICGFANLSSLGMMIGNLGALCPEKRSNIVEVSVRALIAGSIICFINASIAGNWGFFLFHFGPPKWAINNFEAFSIGYSINRTTNAFLSIHLRQWCLKALQVLETVKEKQSTIFMLLSCIPAVNSLAQKKNRIALVLEIVFFSISLLSNKLRRLISMSCWRLHLLSFNRIVQ